MPVRIALALFMVVAVGGCGGCEENGGSYEPCVGSECACPINTDRCGDTCVPVTSDPANCGACGHDCGSAACYAGVCLPELLARVPNAPSELQVAGDDLLFVTHGRIASSGAVFRMPKDGGSPEVIYGGISDFPELAVADDGAVLVADSGQLRTCSTTGSAGAIVSISGGQASLVSTGRRCVAWLVAAADGVAWIEEVSRGLLGGDMPNRWIGTLLAGAPPDQAPTLLRPPLATRNPQNLMRAGDALMWNESDSILHWASGAPTSVVYASGGVDAFTVDTDTVAYE